MYEALVDIGDYKKGDNVPDELAIVWDKQYRYSPVKKVDGKDGKSEKKEKAGPSTETTANAMEDDYLNRNKHVVKKNLENDMFDEATLNRLLKLEEDNKNRSAIINTIKYKLRMMD